MRVRNITSTSENKCSCGSWLDHWKKFARITLNTCSVQGCTGTDLVGGHVLKESTSDQSWYIVPLCVDCNNQRGQALDIRDNVTLVSANVAETCEKGGLINSARR